MVEKHVGQKKAQEFIENNLQYSNFREMAVKSAMNKKVMSEKYRNELYAERLA